jgi:predicted AAA+ superfamily ATPase
LTSAEIAVYLTTMSSDRQVFRWLSTRLPSPDTRRIVVLTGARQTGKTTLARTTYPDLHYVNLDSIEDREVLRDIHTSAWARTVGDAVLDEAQKEPSVFEKIKWAFDEGEIRFTALLGSSRILLLDKVRETLAGRSFLYDLWPLTASELRHEAGDTPPPPLIQRILTQTTPLDELLRDEPPSLLGSDEAVRRDAVEHLLRWGGMPGLLPLDEADRRDWLRSYQQTYLERDLADLVRLNDLHPFRTLQRICMLRSGQLLSYSELARDAGLAPTTARRYLEYLRISYQTILLRPYHRNLTSRQVKAPKLYWMDLGLLREGSRQWGEPTGAMFETLVVGEIHKLVNTLALDAELHFYRTRSGMEVDLLLETPRGVLAVEVKNRKSVAPSDARAMRALRKHLGSEWRGGFVVHRGTEIAPVSPEHSIWAVPIHRLI